MTSSTELFKVMTAVTTLRIDFFTLLTAVLER
jgi:hypothetical protein